MIARHCTQSFDIMELWKPLEMHRLQAKILNLNENYFLYFRKFRKLERMKTNEKGVKQKWEDRETQSVIYR